jgi:hypothetical protein
MVGVAKTKTTKQIDDMLNISSETQQLSDAEITDLINKIKER